MSSLVEKKYHVFDCDGVLLDSNELKIDALEKTLLTLGAPIEFVRKAKENFRLNFGRTRGEHFNSFLELEVAGGYRLESASVAEAINKYGEYVQALYRSCPVIQESISYISSAIPHQEECFVVSASDQAELRAVLPRRFEFLSETRVFGGPVKKSNHLVALAGRLGIENMTFYGDSVQDARAGLETGVRFVGLSKYSADPRGLRSFCEANDLACFNECLELLP